ncbi:RHS repeat domain-containing protein [Streptacidiphilus sp. P02-A3a]|uniref:RHS repeat domain-containing protein n=1 Tax=Streptacidiphilus sp. P02-A3a TaxID=2704468 RepID=UPI0015FE32AD|nr:RHS repeat-associated core domain-containing protein [Streptacidiphilus sp. P02-A3a]QMU70625.1 RHS repeat-associated core domain-containing protein [Streptacidiphilus sp. P02-A3a]
MSGGSAGDGGGPEGTYGTTSLKAAGSWTAGGSNGSFQYGYDITVPPAGSSLTPKLSLSYDSGSVDGQTSATQAQAGWIGDGWDMPQSFIEETFTSCADSPEGSASPTSTGDDCYAGPVLTLSLNGSSTDLVWDATAKVWKTADDDGNVVAHVTGSNNGDGTYNTDYYTVTDSAGTVYSFGLNHLPGWTTGKAATNSVDTEPVYSAHSGDPCYSSSGFTSSVCTMGYRYNLDYVKDVHGNAMAYYYDQDTNYYGQDNGAKNTSYVRDSHLDHVDYGFTDGNAYGTVADRVSFATADRCMAGASACDPLNSTTEANWPDVPFDQACASGATCASYSPSFYSTVRLASITTEQWDTLTSAYNTVDTYTLNQTMPTDGDGGATLWLASVSRKGSDSRATGSATAITLPSVSFGMIDLPNRVDTVTDGLPPLYRFRISSVTTESGSVIGVDYGLNDPCKAPVTITPSSNTSSCYPVYWTPEGYSAPFLDWFNKYVVQEVTQSDPTGGAPVMQTSYKYSGAAWHYDDNEVVQAKYRSYGQWRGYSDVKTFTGDGVNDPQTESETQYYQGMSDDNNSTAVTLTDSQGGKHDDADQLAGEPMESTTYLGSGGPVNQSTITSYWVSPATASRARTGLPALTANLVEPVENWSRTADTDGGTTTWRISETDTSYDTTLTDADFGLPQVSYTHTVPAQAAYDRCTTTSYAPANTSENLVGLVSGAETDSVACGGFTEGSVSSVPGSLNTLTAPGTVSRPAQVVSATRSFYDDPTDAAKPSSWPSLTFPQTTAPTKGEVSIVQKANGYSGSAFGWTTTSAQVFDAAGRGTDAYDPVGSDTHTTYTTDTVGLVTGTTTTNALSQSVSVTLDPARNLTLTSTDANGIVTTTQYDTLGRATSVWTASRPTSSPANNTYSYLVSNTGVTAVTTDTMNDESGYNVSTVIYDALLRPRQTQTPTPQGGRLVTDTFYDTRGWKSATYKGWWDPATTPDTTLVSAANLKDEVPNQDYYTYDGLGRVVVDSSEKDNVVVSSTTTIYNGDRTTVIPTTAPIPASGVIPAGGGTVTSTVTDPLGRTTELDSYTSAPTLNTPTNTFTGTWSIAGGTSQAITYGYDSHDNQNTTTAGGSTWTDTYNLLGQITAKSDPDAGNSTMTYDAAGNLTQATDALGHTVSTTYDALGRKTAQYNAATTAQSSSNETASWIYDNSNNVTGVTDAIGQLTTSTAYNNGAAYVTQAGAFNAFGESKGETITIPSAEGALAGTYTFQHTYSTNTGLLLKDINPAAGGLPAESVIHGYAGALDLPNTLIGANGYTQGVTYDAFGRVEQETIGASTSEAYLTNTFDLHTSELSDELITRSTATPADVDDESYQYDTDGNITSQTSTRLGSSSSSETQCNQYDSLQRLTQAWTATDSCAATPTAGNSSTVGDGISGGAYWTSWTFDALGNRQTETDHSTTGGTDATTDYAYNGNGTNQPQTLTSTTGGTSGPTNYGYDADGNMTSRTTPSTGTQTLIWSPNGQLTNINGGTAGNSSFVYDASGSLLLEKDPGSTTLYLSGEQLTLTGTTVTGTRFYDLPGGGTAVRTAAGNNYQFQFSDQHGTNGLALDYTAQNPTWRQFTPYGAPRGTTVSWADNRGFLNAPTDTSTGLTVVGSREYDPTTGRFISLDPLFEATSLQQLNGYSYAEDDPINQSDPTGNMVMIMAGDAVGSAAAVEGYYARQSAEESAAQRAAIRWQIAEDDYYYNYYLPAYDQWQQEMNRWTAYNAKTHCAGGGKFTTCRSQAQIDQGNASLHNLVSTVADNSGTVGDAGWNALGMLAGAGGAAGGGVLAASGVGECALGVPCVVGAPSLAGGLAVATPSAGLMIKSATGFGEDLNTLMNASSSDAASADGPSNPGPAPTMNSAQYLGRAREKFVADLIGGTDTADENGQGMMVTRPNVGSTDVDVIGPNGEYVGVGGSAKALSPTKFGSRLSILKWTADQKGVAAQYYLAQGTPQSAIDQATKALGAGNVFIFDMG